jgi:hypothetical protein
MRTAQNFPLFGSNRTSVSSESSLTEGAKHIATDAISRLDDDDFPDDAIEAVDLTQSPKTLILGASGQLSKIGWIGLKVFDFKPPKSNTYSSLHQERTLRSWRTAPWIFSQHGPITLHLTSTSSVSDVLAPKILEKDFPVKSAFNGGNLAGYAILKKFSNPWGTPFSSNA